MRTTPIDPTSPLRTPGGASVPLLGVSISGEVVGGYARITSTQRYRHEELQPVEAVYVFPLPSDAAVTGFVMEVAGRRLDAEVKEREEAFRVYDEALTSGHGATLLEQERPNVFTANVGNLLPREEVMIAISFVTKLASDEGALRLMLPTLVAPRYIPGAPSGDRTAHGSAAPTTAVPDADRISPRIAEVDYTLSVDLRLAFDAQALLSSPSHAIRAVHDNGAWRLTLSGAPLDRDLVVLVEPDERASLERVVAHREESAGEGFVTLSWVPDLRRLAPRREAGDTFSFVLDRSGSMGGASLEEARRALRLCLRQLREGDRFEVIAFDDRVETFEPEPVPYTERTLAAADRWIAGIDARGGTELLAPMVRAARHGGVVVLLTDGQVGNEDQILAEVLGASAATRIYTFGIGTNVSDALLAELAKRTGGTMELVYPGERIDEKVVATFAKAHAIRVARPVIEVVGVELDDLAPSRAPDLVDGEPWSISARYARGGRAEVRIRGSLAGGPFVHVLVADLPDRADAPLVPLLWARERIRDLEAQEVTGRRAAAMKERIVSLATTHRLASRYTSFVVVEKRTGDRRTTGAAVARAVPVSAPHGWAMFDAASPALTTGTGSAATLRQRGAVATGIAPTPRSPAPLAAPAHGGAYGSRPTGTPPPAPAAAPARLRAVEAADADAFADAAPFSLADSAGIDDDAKDVGAFDAVRTYASLGSAVAPGTGQRSSLERTLEAQRASGLWDASAASLAATIDALRVLVREGLTTSHPVYGGNAKKAVEAVVAAAARASIPAAERELALLLAYLVASGPRSRAAVLEALRVHAPEAEARTQDEAALSAALLAPT